jgi:hypothetical protein
MLEAGLESKANKVDLEKKCNQLGDFITGLSKDIS